jgi:hypothetical protein
MTVPFRRSTRFLVGAFLAVLVSVSAGVPPVAAQSGADLAADISGKRVVRLGENITYTITATNVGDATATDVRIDYWAPDWFDTQFFDCGSGTFTGSLCSYPDLAPGASASMTVTLNACCPEKHMYEMGSVFATNDVDLSNNSDSIKVNFTGPR